MAKKLATDEYVFVCWYFTRCKWVMFQVRSVPSSSKLK